MLLDPRRGRLPVRHIPASSRLSNGHGVGGCQYRSTAANGPWLLLPATRPANSLGIGDTSATSGSNDTSPDTSGRVCRQGEQICRSWARRARRDRLEERAGVLAKLPRVLRRRITAIPICCARLGGPQGSFKVSETRFTISPGLIIPCLPRR